MRAALGGLSSREGRGEPAIDAPALATAAGLFQTETLRSAAARRIEELAGGPDGAWSRLAVHAAWRAGLPPPPPAGSGLPPAEEIVCAIAGGASRSDVDLTVLGDEVAERWRTGSMSPHDRYFALRALLELGGAFATTARSTPIETLLEEGPGGVEGDLAATALGVLALEERLRSRAAW